MLNIRTWFISSYKNALSGKWAACCGRASERTCSIRDKDTTHLVWGRERVAQKAKRKWGKKPEGFLKYGLIIKYFKASSAFLTNIWASPLTQHSWFEFASCYFVVWMGCCCFLIPYYEFNHFRLRPCVHISRIVTCLKSISGVIKHITTSKCYKTPLQPPPPVADALIKWSEKYLPNNSNNSRSSSNSSNSRKHTSNVCIILKKPKLPSYSNVKRVFRCVCLCVCVGGLKPKSTFN